MARSAKQMAYQPCFKMRVVKAKKGKGSFKRKPKHENVKTKGESLN